MLDAAGQPVADLRPERHRRSSPRVFTGLDVPEGGPARPDDARRTPLLRGADGAVSETATTPNAKTLLNGTVAARRPDARSRTSHAAVRNVFMHPNVGPFIGRQLIQRLVTGNPSPGLRRARRGRVQQQRRGRARRPEGGGARRSCSTPRRAGRPRPTLDFGQLREPVLMITGLLRAHERRDRRQAARRQGGRATSASGPYSSPTVFNYFPPDTTIPGTDILGPEFGIHTTSTAVAVRTSSTTLVYGGYAADATVPDCGGHAVRRPAVRGARRQRRPRW